jgi:diacylglycerol kinase (ATP)
MGHMKTFLIVNPEAAGGRSLKLWSRLSDRIFERIGLFEYAFTNASGAASLLATQAALEGYERVIAVGGDGTVNEVLNGLFGDDDRLINPDMVLACLPSGSGTDFWKTLGVPERTRDALDHLASTKQQRCDVGRVKLQSHDRQPMVRYFCNVADVGFGGVVVDRAKKIDGKKLPPEPLIIAMIANGQYCGGGMCVAPAARLDSGSFQLVRIQPITWSDAMQLFPKLYTGGLVNHDAVSSREAREITVTTSAPLRVTLDGEIPGGVPATFSIVPRAVRFQI